MKHQEEFRRARFAPSLFSKDGYNLLEHLRSSPAIEEFTIKEDSET